MAYVVRRPKGRFELRESVHTANGPRARTLSTFTTLDEQVLSRAAASASTPFDADDVRASAERAGAPVAESAADAAARTLLYEVAHTRRPNPALRRLLHDAFERDGGDAPSDAGDIALWFNASTAQRGDALRDLLDLADALPPPRIHPRKLTSPRLSPARRG